LVTTQTRADPKVSRSKASKFQSAVPVGVNAGPLLPDLTAAEAATGTTSTSAARAEAEMGLTGEHA
jgi:hypothetical protein